ncbi:MAG: PaaI family thioesterase [Acidimicrobiales bacterium]
MAEVRESVEAGEHFGRQMQMRDVLETDDTLAIEMPVGAHMRNTRGGLQGGLVAALVDITAGRLAMAGVDAGHSTATVDLNIHFLLPIVVGPARATATVVRRGRRTVVVRVDVDDVGRERLAATATVQFVVLENFVGAPTEHE